MIETAIVLVLTIVIEVMFEHISILSPYAVYVSYVMYAVIALFVVLAVIKIIIAARNSRDK